MDVRVRIRREVNFKVNGTKMHILGIKLKVACIEKKRQKLYVLSQKERVFGAIGKKVEND